MVLGKIGVGGLRREEAHKAHDQCIDEALARVSRHGRQLAQLGAPGRGTRCRCRLRAAGGQAAQVRSKLCQRFVQRAVPDRVVPGHRDALARHTGPQVGVTLIGDALFRPLIAEPLEAIVPGASREQHAVGLVPHQHEVHEGRRQHADAGQPDDGRARVGEPVGVRVVVAAEHDDARVARDPRRGRDHLLTQA